MYGRLNTKESKCHSFHHPRFLTVQEMFLINQHLLNALGVGHHSLDQVLAIALQHGLAAKLTGGGGGGCAIILLHPGEPRAILSAC